MWSIKYWHLNSSKHTIEQSETACLFWYSGQFSHEPENHCQCYLILHKSETIPPIKNFTLEMNSCTGSSARKNKQKKKRFLRLPLIFDVKITRIWHNSSNVVRSWPEIQCLLSSVLQGTAWSSGIFIFKS